MKYLIVGGGAMGSVLAAYMTRAGKDVTLVTRGAHLEAIRQQGGLELYYAPTDSRSIVPVRAVAEDEYDENPDVILLTVKEYSLESVLPLVDRVSTGSTVVLPLMNALDIGRRVARELSTSPVVGSGAAYVACELVGPGKCMHKLDFFRMVIGPREGQPVFAGSEAIVRDLTDSGCEVQVEDDMLRAGLEKFCRVSAASGAMVYFNSDLGGVRRDPTKFEFALALVRELVAVAKASGHAFAEDFDPVANFIAANDYIPDDYKTSLMYDFLAGKQVEWRTMFQDPFVLGQENGLAMPAYRQVCGVFDSEILGRAWP